MPKLLLQILNALRLGWILAVLAIIGAALGKALGGGVGVWVGVGLVAFLALTIISFSGRLILSNCGADPLVGEHGQGLEDLVAEVAADLRLHAPRIWISQDAGPLLFVLGPSPRRGHLVISTGLLQVLTRDQARQAVAIQLLHLSHRDTWPRDFLCALSLILGRPETLFTDETFRPVSRDMLFVPSAILFHLALLRPQILAAERALAKRGEPRRFLSEALEQATIAAKAHPCLLPFAYGPLNWVEPDFESPFATLASVHPQRDIHASSL